MIPRWAGFQGLSACACEWESSVHLANKFAREMVNYLDFERHGCICVKMAFEVPMLRKPMGLHQKYC